MTQSPPVGKMDTVKRAIDRAKKSKKI